jgi:hypothetical protein
MFRIVWKIALPFFNACGILISGIAIVLHFYRKCFSKDHHTPPVDDGCCRLSSISNTTLILTVQILEFISCTLRLFYCYLCPLYSTNRFTLKNGQMLLRASLPIEIVVSMIASVLFIRWGSFPGEGEAAIRRICYITVLAMLYPVVTSISFNTSLVDAYRIVYMLICYLVAAELAAIVTFIRYGSRLLRRLGKKQAGFHHSPWRTRWLRWSLKWILMSVFMKLLCLIGALFAMRLSLWLTPSGNGTSFTLLLVGATGQAVTQSIAFLPALRRAEALAISHGKSNESIGTKRQKQRNSNTTHDSIHSQPKAARAEYGSQQNYDKQLPVMGISTASELQDEASAGVQSPRELELPLAVESNTSPPPEIVGSHRSRTDVSNTASQLL